MPENVCLWPFYLKGTYPALNSRGHNSHPSGPCGAAHWPWHSTVWREAGPVSPVHVTLDFCPDAHKLLSLTLELSRFISISHMMLMALDQFRISTFKSLFWESFFPSCLNIFHHCSICFIFLLRNINCKAVVALWSVFHII